MVSLPELIGIVVSSNVIVALILWLRLRRKDNAEATKLLAEAHKINVETDSVVSTGWRQVAEALKEERDKALQRIDELEVMLEKEEEMHKEKTTALRTEKEKIEIQLRDLLKEERERYDKRINEILQQILDKIIKN